MKQSVSFKRHYHVFMPTGLIPSKKSERALMLMKECKRDKCEEKDLPPDLRSIKLRSDKGYTMDISEPHEMRFSFDGKMDCQIKNDEMICSLGDPQSRDVSERGEFVSKIESDTINIRNIPHRYAWQLGIYTGMNIAGPLALMTHPLLIPFGIAYYFLNFPFVVIPPLEILSMTKENKDNHWFLDNMEEDINELNITPDRVREVELDMKHPLLTTARIKLKDKMVCNIHAEPKGIDEWKVLTCI